MNGKIPGFGERNLQHGLCDPEQDAIGLEVVVTRPLERRGCDVHSADISASQLHVVSHRDRGATFRSHQHARGMARRLPLSTILRSAAHTARCASERHSRMSMEDCTLYYQNVRGLRTKADDFYSNVATANYPILCLTETWLDDSCASAQYFTPGYTVFRRDRN